MVFTEEHQKLVVSSWNVMKKDSASISLKFFLKMFEVAPSTKELFPFLRDSDVPLEENPRLKAHALTVFNSIGESATQLHKEGTVTAKDTTSERIAEMHANPVITTDPHFSMAKYWAVQTMKEQMVNTREVGLPGMWSEETEEAWGEAFDQLPTAIKDSVFRI